MYRRVKNYDYEYAYNSMQLFSPINIFAKYFFLVKSYASETCAAVSQSQPFLIYLITKSLRREYDKA